MKVVKVYGPLRKYLGQCRFEFVADTPAQAMKALCVNFPGLAQWLLDREAEGMAFRVTRGRDKITNEAPEGLVLPWSEREVFSIAPVIVGAGRGVGKNPCWCWPCSVCNSYCWCRKPLCLGSLELAVAFLPVLSLWELLLLACYRRYWRILNYRRRRGTNLPYA
jgi:hypothetical protein